MLFDDGSRLGLSQGLERVSPVVGQGLAEIVTVDAWDGQDAAPPEEEFSLEDLDKVDL